MAREDYLADKYTEADKKLIKIFQEEVKKLDLLYFRAINSSDREKWKQILSKIKEINKVLKANYDEWADVEIPKEYLKGATYIDDTLEWDNSISVVLEADEKEVRNMIKWLWPVHLEAVNALLNTSKNYVKSSLDWMERQAITMLNELEWEKVREELARWTLLWESLTSMEERIKRYFQNNKISWFKDRAGRLWSMDRYVDMLTRTETAIANIQGTINRAIQLWHTKFKVVENSDCCSFCADENGKIVDIAKGTVDLPPFHPNCRWYIIVVNEIWEEMSISSKGETYDKETAKENLKKTKISKKMQSNEDIREAWNYIKDRPYEFEMWFENAVIASAYTWELYSSINKIKRWLVNEDEYDDKYWKRWMKIINESLSNSIIAYWSNIEWELFRGVWLSKEMFNEVVLKKSYTDKWFMSFSKEWEVSKDFMIRTFSNEVKVIFRLDNWYWLETEDFSLHKREREVIINAETEFDVLEAEPKVYTSPHSWRNYDYWEVRIRQKF